MTEPSASPSKRRDGRGSSVPGGVQREGRGLETGEPPLQQPPVRPRGPGEEPRGARPPRGGGDDGAGRTEPRPGDWGAAPHQVGARGWLTSPEGGRLEGTGVPLNAAPARPGREHVVTRVLQEVPEGEKPGSLLQEGLGLPGCTGRAPEPLTSCLAGLGTLPKPAKHEVKHPKAPA